jgi:hypothetical protein
VLIGTVCGVLRGDQRSLVVHEAPSPVAQAPDGCSPGTSSRLVRGPEDLHDAGCKLACFEVGHLDLGGVWFCRLLTQHLEGAGQIPPPTRCADLGEVVGEELGDSSSVGSAPRCLQLEFEGGHLVESGHGRVSLGHVSTLYPSSRASKSVRTGFAHTSRSGRCVISPRVDRVVQAVTVSGWERLAAFIRWSEYTKRTGADVGCEMEIAHLVVAVSTDRRLRSVYLVGPSRT